MFYSWRQWLLTGLISLGVLGTVAGWHPALGLQDMEQDEAALANKNSEIWKQKIEQHLLKNVATKAITDKYGYSFIHSKTKFQTTGLHHCAYNFVYSTSDENKHKGNVQLIYHYQGNPMALEVNVSNASNNLIADIGEWEFTKDCDVNSIQVNANPTWQLSAKAVEGHTYVIRIFDEQGNRFFVLLRVVYVDPKGEYVAFTWRKMKTQGEVIHYKTPS